MNQFCGPQFLPGFIGKNCSTSTFSCVQAFRVKDMDMYYTHWLVVLWSVVFRTQLQNIGKLLVTDVFQVPKPLLVTVGFTLVHHPWF